MDDDAVVIRFPIGGHHIIVESRADDPIRGTPLCEKFSL